jgi:mannose-6-phosphate isomerase-like protein (cupin superfamily)
MFRICLATRGIRLEAVRFTSSSRQQASSRCLTREPMRTIRLAAIVLVMNSSLPHAQAQAPQTQTPPPQAQAPAAKPAPAAPQTQGQAPPPQAAAPVRRAPPAPQPASIIVRNLSGTPIEGVRIQISGAESQSLTTDAQGTASVTLPDGSYRLRFEHEDFITLEREVAIKGARPEKMEVALNRAAVEPAPPPPPAPEPPAPPPVPEPAVPSGPATSLSISTYLDKNFIGREPLKESVVGCTPGAMTRVLQLRDPLAPHAHNQVDEILYVVAGNGSFKIGDETVTVAAGSLSVIPRGLRHSIERSGRNPLIVLSTLAGAPCQDGALTQP